MMVSSFVDGHCEMLLGGRKVLHYSKNQHKKCIGFFCCCCCWDQLYVNSPFSGKKKTNSNIYICCALQLIDVNVLEKFRKIYSLCCMLHER